MTILLIGATDMQQMIEAAAAIQREHESATPTRAQGRTADIDELATSTAVEGLVFREGWWRLPGEWLRGIIDVATRQRDRWRAEAAEIRRRLADSK